MPVYQLMVLWSLLQILPLAIVFALYYFFDSKNFFSIEGFWKGILASGPIAAYVFISWLSFRNFKELAGTFNPVDRFEDLVGSWKIEAVSSHDTKAQGHCEISQAAGRLHLHGTFEEQGQQTVVWQSDIAFVDGNRMFYVYKLETGVGNYVGYVRLLVRRSSAPRNAPVRQLSGEWVAVGQQLKRGQITFRRT